jgi:hypothetical protein
MQTSMSGTPSVLAKGYPPSDVTAGARPGESVLLDAVSASGSDGAR